MDTEGLVSIRVLAQDRQHPTEKIIRNPLPLLQPKQCRKEVMLPETHGEMEPGALSIGRSWDPRGPRDGHVMRC